MRSLIIKTKFIAPSTPELKWINKKLWEKYNKSTKFPLTVVKAGPGYGKSTTLSSYINENYEEDYYWYSIDELDTDPALFFLNFIHAFKFKNNNIGDEAIRFLNQSGNKGIPIKQVLDIFINELLNEINKEKFIILDDFHLVNNKNKITELLSYFIKRMPPNLHLIISSREDVNFSQFANWKLKRKLLLIGEKDLSLNIMEIDSFLKNEYDIKLNKKELKNIYSETEGWIMAIDLIGEGLNNGARVEDIINNETESLHLLFEYLAFEVLENQSEEIKEFLLKTAVLKYLRIDICNQLLDINNSKEIIEEIVDKRLFIYYLGNDQYRYHNLFHEFLKEQGKKKFNYKKLHKKAAEICEKTGEKGFAIYHSLGAEDYYKSAKLILSSAEKLLELGRLDTLQNALNQLPESIFSEYPLLYVYQGDTYRLRSHFDQALANYKKAQDFFYNKDNNLYLSIVLQKIAMIYLDTVQPAKADQYLKKALKLRDQENLWDESILLKLMAENKANEGHLKEAEKLYKQAENINEEEVANNNFSARVKLRTGRLKEAQKILEKKVENEKKGSRIPRSHRETILILSLIHSFMGNSFSAMNYAQGGIYLGEELNSPFIKAVAYMRLGHAYQIKGKEKVKKARNAYNKSLDIIDEFNIPRGKAEPLMGLSLLEAFYGDCDLGLRYGKKGLKIARQAGDEWLSGILDFSIAINHYFKDNLKESEEKFLDNIIKFKKLNDEFIKTVNRIWLSLVYYEEEKMDKFDITVKNLFDIMEKRNFNFIFLNATLFGGDSPERFIPVLLAARDRSVKEDHVKGILAELGFSHLKNHPGFKLKIKALGNFQVWRGKNEITQKDWEREKAKELFLLFLIHIGELIPKEKIYYYLWPEKEKEKASRNFKVTLNALKNALEPLRKPRQKPFFLVRHGSSYGFNENSGYIYDVEKFQKLIEKGENTEDTDKKIKYFKSAINKYDNDFVVDKLYLDWVRNERERLKSMFLNTGDKLIEIYFERAEYQKCIDLSNKMLEIDNCWEKAYLYKMKSYNKLDRRSMAIKIYKRCKRVLDRELNVFPISEIESYYQNLT
ncbi:MAG: BTAD domain-containing putative transcriptional regulator [Bacillota bacterium]